MWGRSNSPKILKEKPPFIMNEDKIKKIFCARVCHIRKKQDDIITNVVDPDWFWSAGSGFVLGMPDPDPGGHNLPTKDKSRKTYEISCFQSAGCSLFRAEGLSCSLDSLQGAQETNFFPIFDKKKYFFPFNFLTILRHQNPCISTWKWPQNPWICFHIDRIFRIRISTNADPQHRE